MLLLLASMSCIIQHSFAYNVETELPVIRRGDAGSYFGFSVANHAFEGYFDLKNHSWLLVGAPKANNSEVAEIASPGVVYRCDFRNDPGCEEVPFDKKGNTDGDRKDNSWFGVSVISAGYNGYVMACTHRLLHIEGSFYTYPGRCIGTASLEEKDLRTTSYETCEQKNQNKANQGGPDTINYKEHKYCQMGVAASILKSENVPLAGAPGAYNYQGEFIYLKRPQQEVFKNNSEHGYQGYSLTHGSFFKKDKDDVVSGAPRFNHHGMVVVFRNLGQGKFHSTPTVLLPPEIMEGSEKRRQPGTGFGLALCAADLNNDGLSELLVGAPFYSDDLHPEQGKVYSYENRGDGNLVLSLELTVKKDKWRANFGRALASVGDLDLDGYRDVAIGAPYEDGGEGVVYIYRGSKNGLVETPMQVIKGSSVSPGIKSFGYSLSGRLDMDFNGYSDILIGAYQSDTVVLLRSKPVISLSSTIKINPDTFDIKGPKTCNATTQEGNTQFATYCFSISVCTKYTERSGNVTDKIDVLLLMNSDIDYVVESSKRVLFKANKKDEINRTEGILNSDKTCFTWEAYIREGVTDADVYPDIKFKLTYQIVKKTPPTPGSPTELPSLVPYSVLDPAKPQEATALLTFKRDCIKCVPDLILDDSKSKRTLAVGAETYKVKVTVTNKGDDAYNAKLYVTIPKGIKIGRIFTLRDTEGEDVLKGGKIEETKLDSNDTLLSIKLNTPLKKKEQSIQIELRTERYADSPDFLPIYLSANSTNEEDKETLADNKRFLNISIKSQADLEVNGTTVEEQVSYGGKVVGESAMVRASDIGNQVKHKYFVKNRGPDQVPSTDIVIQWPFEAPSGKHLLYLIAVQFDDKRVKCDFKPGQLNMLGLETSLSGNSGQQQNDTSEDAGANKRRRREADDNQEESSTKVKREADPPKAEKLQTDLDCKLGSAKCTNIRCTINFLQAGDDVTFTIVSRLWNGTMIEDYEGQLLRVISHATVRSLNTYVQETNKDNNKAQVGTQLNPDADVAVPSKGLPKWVIPVCVAGAILLLVLIVFCLYKLGFFKRQKYDKNITNPEEAEGMLDNGKGYHV